MKSPDGRGIIKVVYVCVWSGWRHKRTVWSSCVLNGCYQSLIQLCNNISNMCGVVGYFFAFLVFHSNSLWRQKTSTSSSMMKRSDNLILVVWVHDVDLGYVHIHEKRARGIIRAWICAHGMHKWIWCVKIPMHSAETDKLMYLYISNIKSNAMWSVIIE